jgi:asparagine synthase (glutamine-hydrolysing)
MCGIAGIVSLNKQPVKTDRLKPMCDIQAHRGPDDAGYAFFNVTEPWSDQGESWCNLTDDRFGNINPQMPVLGESYAQQELASRAFQVALGHRRLAIQDLSSHGHQPMGNSDQRFWVVFNGEIYNFPDLRERLEGEGYVFRTQCDTEVILAGWQQWGVECLKQLNGMFAFAIYDRKENVLRLVRDRFGVKPLYYSVTGNQVLFASEIKGILASGLLRSEIHTGAMVEYFTFQNTFGRQTLFENVQLLQPGEMLVIQPASGKAPVVRHFCPGFPVAAVRPDGHEASEREKLSATFETAVRRQLIGDVEIGAYLSGGMDSGSIVSVAGRSIPRLSTFTGGFDLANVNGIEQGFDEREMAEKLSFLLGTEHYAIVQHAGDMPAAMEKITWHMDDPRVGMCHQNWYVSKLAGRMVKVCLTGAGGDELFAGYPWRYRHILNHDSPGGNGDAYYRFWNRLLPPEQLAPLFAIDDFSDAAQRARQNFQKILCEAPAPHEELTPAENALQRALYFEFRTFLHGYLVTEDHISMAHSLESRVPFLDNDLANMAWGIRPKWKFDLDAQERNGGGHIKSSDGKQILRRAAENFLPREFTQQHKQGFSPPDENWYRGPTMDYIKSILYDPSTLERPWFDQASVQVRLEDHFTGRHNNRLLIWSLLSFEWLQRHWVDQATTFLTS